MTVLKEENTIRKLGKERGNDCQQGAEYIQDPGVKGNMTG